MAHYYHTQCLYNYTGTEHVPIKKRDRSIELTSIFKSIDSFYVTHSNRDGIPGVNTSDTKLLFIHETDAQYQICGIGTCLIGPSHCNWL